MKDFIAAQDLPLLKAQGLDSFEALWALKLEAVDEPNTERGGWSSVYRLALEGQAYYLKRQSNHLTRSLARPFGEPTFAREFRNIRRYQQLAIPALEAAFFAQRKVKGEQRALLLTRALDGWEDLYSLFQRWADLSDKQRQGCIRASAELARTLHDAGQMHGCFYPKHIFLREQEGECHARLIDLEKTRPLLLGKRDRIKDLEPLIRRADPWGDEEVASFVGHYLDRAVETAEVQQWVQRLAHRRRAKGKR